MTCKYDLIYLINNGCVVAYRSHKKRDKDRIKNLVFATYFRCDLYAIYMLIIVYMNHICKKKLGVKITPSLWRGLYVLSD